MPQILGLLAALQVLEDVVELHHAHRGQAEGASGAANGIHKVIVVCRSQMDQPMVDVLWRKQGENVGMVTKWDTKLSSEAYWGTL